MDDWACNICTFINKSNKTNCEQCTTEKTYLNSDIFLNALKKVNSSLFNEINRISSLEISNEERSAQYFGSLSKYFKQTSREEVSHWKCNNCNVLNPNIVDLCTVCNASNPNVLYQRSDSYREAQRIALELEKLEREYFDCPVCMDDKASINGSYTLDCNHRICYECIPTLVTIKINSNEVSEEQLHCPYENCKCTILEVTVRELCPNEIYQKFLNFRKDRYIFERSISGTIRKCPTDRCNYHFEIDDTVNSEGVNNSIHFDCPECSQSYCFYCKANNGQVGPGHPQMSCADRIEQLQKEEAERKRFAEWQVLNANADESFQKWVRESGSKPCPNCKHVIERNEGCDHMTCLKCKCNFCYRCGKWDSSNPQNRGDCGVRCKRQ